MNKPIYFVTKEEFSIAFDKFKIDWNNLIKANEDFTGKKEVETRIKSIVRFLKKKDTNQIDLILANRLFSEVTLVGLKGKLDYQYIIDYCEASEKIKNFCQYVDNFTDQEYWENLSYCYSMQDYKTVPYEVISSLFNSQRKFREFLMSEEERSFVQNLPELVKIYRGMSIKEYKSKKFRFSWTLNESIADFFVKRNSLLYNCEFIVCELLIPKDKITAFFKERNEEEIIYIS